VKPGGAPGKRIPAMPVNGHSAYWIFTPNASGQSSFELRWQYAQHAWADLTGNSLHGDKAEVTRTAYKIAKSVTFGGARPIPMPLHVDGVPGGLTPKRSVLNAGAWGQINAALEFIVKDRSSDLMIGISNTANTGGKPTLRTRANATLDGRPAFQRPGQLYVFGVNGFDVQILASGSVLDELNKTGGLVGLFHKMTVLGSDQANWTTNPVN
jgi:hypothetical protein